MKAHARIKGTFAVILGTLVVTANVHAAVVFFDDFNDGDAEDGNPVTWTPNPGGGCLDGTYDASSGDYHFWNRSSTPSGCMHAVAEEYELDSTSVRTQFLQGTKNVGIQLRGNSAESSSYIGVLHRDAGKLFIYREDPPIDSTSGNLVLLNEAKLPFNPLILDVDVILQFDAFGDELSLRAWPADEPMPAAPYVTAYDTTFTAGTVGLVSVPGGQGYGDVFFRYVYVADERIPEPSSIVLALVGLAGLVTFALKRKVGTP
ncbi:MAG: PEP-CTERM sorting domain-containing protein [Pirellulaceae bacterium]